MSELFTPNSLTEAGVRDALSDSKNGTYTYRKGLNDLGDAMKDFDELLALEGTVELTHVRDKFETYFEEAKFFLPIMQKHFQSIKPKSVAEIGSGLGLLAMILSREVENFVAFEPSSAGYEEVRDAQKVLDKQLEHNVVFDNHHFQLKRGGMTSSTPSTLWNISQNGGRWLKMPFSRSKKGAA